MSTDPKHQRLPTKEQLEVEDGNQSRPKTLNGNKSRMDLKDPKTQKIIGGSVVGAVLLIIIIVVVVLTTGGGPKEDCSEGTKFANLRREAKFGSYYLKYEVYPSDVLALSLLSWDSARTKCAEMGAQLWEVEHGEDEWNAIYPKLKADRLASIWINGTAKKFCEVENQECKQAEAASGEGLEVEWPSSKTTATYSRFIGGPKDGCMSANQDDLWVNVSCENKKKRAVCVKRDCEMPATKE